MAKRMVNPFRKLLLKVSKQLRENDVEEMANLIVGEDGFPGEREMEKVKNDGMKFFLLLQKYDKISATDCDLLIELLGDIGRRDLVKLVNLELNTDLDTSKMEHSQSQVPAINPPILHGASSKELTSNTNITLVQNSSDSTPLDCNAPLTASTPATASQRNLLDQSVPQTPAEYIFERPAASEHIRESPSPRPSPDGPVNSSQDSGASSSSSPRTTPDKQEQERCKVVILVDETPKTSKLSEEGIQRSRQSKASVTVPEELKPNFTGTDPNHGLYPSNLPKTQQQQPDQATASNSSSHHGQPLASPSKNISAINTTSGNKLFDFGSLKSHPEQFDQSNTLMSIGDNESNPSTSDMGGLIEISSALSSATSTDSNYAQQNNDDRTTDDLSKGNLPDMHLLSNSDIQGTDRQTQLAELSVDGPATASLGEYSIPKVTDSPEVPERLDVTSNDLEIDAEDECADSGTSTTPQTSGNYSEQTPIPTDDPKTSGSDQSMKTLPSNISLPENQNPHKQLVKDLAVITEGVAHISVHDGQNGASASPSAATNKGNATQDSASDNQPNEPIKTLRAYQKELATPPKSGHNYIICAPTGSGKTLTAATICHHFYEEAIANQVYFKALFIVNIRHLTHQQRYFFKERFPRGAVGSINDNDQLKDILFAEDKYVVMVTAQIVVNALNKGDINLQDVSMIVFDECHHTTLNHPYNEIMKRYLKEKKTKMGLRAVVGESGHHIPQIIGLSASLGVGKDAFLHALTLCSNMDAKNVLQVLEHKDELAKYVNAPENDDIKYVTPRHAEQRDLGHIIEGIMCRIESELWDGDDIISEHGTSAYEQWVRDQQTKAECTAGRDRDKYIASVYLFEYNRALSLYEDLRASDSFDYLNEFMQQRNVDQKQLPTEELCRNHFEADLTEMKRICHKETTSPNPKLWELANLLREKFTSKPDSKGIILTRMRLATTALKEFIEKERSLQGLPRPIKPVRLVGQGEGDNHYMTENEQKHALNRFRNDDCCNLLVATDIAQEGLDMPACNFVIRFNFVSNEIGTVQSRGRARAKQSECYLIVEEDSINAKRELGNRQKVKDMQKAMDKLNALPEDQRLHQIKETQDATYKDMERKANMAKAAKNLQSADDVEILCKECNMYITRGSYMRRKNGTNYTCIDPDIKERILLVLYEQSDRYRDSETIGKFKCGNPTCGQTLGIAIKFLHDGDFTLEGYGFGVKSFVFRSLGKQKSYKQWQKVPFTIPNYED